MGSATFSEGFGRRTPNNSAFQKTRPKTFSNENSAMQARMALGQREFSSVAPSISNISARTGPGQIDHQLYNEVTASFYESSPGEVYSGTRGSNGFAGFWIRVLAFFIDMLFLSLVQFAVAKIGLLTGILTVPPEILATGINPDGSLAALSATPQWFNFGITPLYFIAMEASPLQGTLGKLALGLRVGDLNGNQIGVGRACCRYLSKIVSAAVLCIGYIMVGLNPKKMGLHDIMCSTCVAK